MNDPRSARAEYLGNLYQIKERAEFHIDPSDPPDAQIQHIRSEAAELHRLQQRNNQLLRDYFFDRNPEQLSPQEAQEWFEFAKALVDDYKQADLGLAYQLHTLLLRRARAVGSWADIVQELYYCGLTLHYLDTMLSHCSANLYSEQVRQYFEEGASFLPQFAQMDHDSRAYMLRCLGNIHLGYTYTVERPRSFEKITSNGDYRDQLRCFDRAYAVMTDPELRAIDPDLPWEDYIYAMHFSRTALLSLVRQNVGGAELRQAVYDSACYVYARQEQAAKRAKLALSTRTVYVHAAASYHMGLMDGDTLLRILMEECERPDDGAGTANLIFRRVSLVCYLQHYSAECPPEVAARYAERIRRASEESFRFVQNLPVSDYFTQAVAYIRNLVVAETTEHISVEDAATRRASFIRWFLTCHRPTYVHSLMVAWLTRTLLRRLVETNPAILQSEVAGDWRGTTDLDKLYARASEAALYHDVGKTALLDVVANYGRRLTDEEFHIIQQHPYIGYWFLMGLGGMEQSAEVSLDHHTFYNRLGGYPRGMDARETNHCCLFSDVVTVADSMDAATDDIGRSYAAAKPLRTLIEELRAGRDTRYAGYVVDLFDDEAFCDWLDAQLTESRRRIYLFSYNRAKDDVTAEELPI